MRYRIEKQMVYMLNAETRESLRLEVGDVVQGVALSSMNTIDRQHANRATQSELQSDPHSRIAFFKAYGVVRYAKAIQCLKPTRSPVTVPVEA
jgi:hypothetical protein